MSTEHLLSDRRSIATRLATFATHRIVEWLALLALCSAYIQGGLTKVLAFDGAIEEMHRFGLQPAALFAGTSITFELGASILILTGFFRWAGALLLAIFTLIVMLIVNRFWSIDAAHRLTAENGFFEHLGLVGGFLVVAWLDLKQALRRQSTYWSITV